MFLEGPHNFLAVSVSLRRQHSDLVIILQEPRIGPFNLAYTDNRCLNIQHCHKSLKH